MKKSNNSVAPGWKLSPSKVVLAALHVLVFTASFLMHLNVETDAARALPEAIGRLTQLGEPFATG